MDGSRRHTVSTTLYHCCCCGRISCIGCSAIDGSSSEILQGGRIGRVRSDVWIIDYERVYIVVRDDICHNLLVLFRAWHRPPTLVLLVRRLLLLLGARRLAMTCDNSLWISVAASLLLGRGLLVYNLGAFTRFLFQRFS